MINDLENKRKNSNKMNNNNINNSLSDIKEENFYKKFKTIMSDGTEEITQIIIKRKINIEKY